jgi:GNAT superfamily N-acetyltransferase
LIKGGAMYFFIDRTKKISRMEEKPSSRRDNEFIGEIEVHQCGEKKFYFCVFLIKERYQKQGYGGKLLNFAIQEVKKRFPDASFEIDCCPIFYVDDDYTGYLKMLAKFYFKTFKQYSSNIKIIPQRFGSSIDEYHISGSF